MGVSKVLNHNVGIDDDESDATVLQAIGIFLGIVTGAGIVLFALSQAVLSNIF